ncbi:MAG: hypothetical protein Ct9H90mP13_12580 [Pseudomonadota bacterium]|nr:MAG: hypothetical protein Ct9H90mP13_12580 [Pseudomonadota bacterium]
MDLGRSSVSPIHLQKRSLMEGERYADAIFTPEMIAPAEVTLEIVMRRYLSLASSFH